MRQKMIDGIDETAWLVKVTGGEFLGFGFSHWLDSSTKKPEKREETMPKEAFWERRGITKFETLPKKQAKREQKGTRGRFSRFDSKIFSSVRASLSQRKNTKTKTENISKTLNKNHYLKEITNFLLTLKVNDTPTDPKASLGV
jgi:hypothetical protein